MKRSIVVVAAGRGLAILWVFATAQVMCQTTVGDGDSAEVYRAISEHKIGLVTQMITNKGLERASRQLHITPLSTADMNPTTDDDDDDDGTAATAPTGEEPKNHYPQQHAMTFKAPEVDNTGTGVYSEQPAEMSQAKDDLSEFGNVIGPSTNNDGQNFGYNPSRPNWVSEHPRGRRNITPFSSADMKQMTNGDDDNDGTVATAAAAEEPKKHSRRRSRPRATVYETSEVDNTGTGVYGEWPAEMSQAKDDLSEFGSVVGPSTNYDGQELGDNPRRSKSVSERPRGRRSKSLVQGLEDPRPVMVQV